MTLLSSLVSISFCLHDRLSICLAVWLQPVGSSFRLLVFLSVGLSVNWSVFRWSVFPLVCLSSRLAGCQSVSWSFRLLVCLSVGLPFVCLSVCRCVCLPRAYLALLFPAHQTISLSIFFVLFVSLIAYVSTNVTVCLFVCLLIYLLLALT